VGRTVVTVALKSQEAIEQQSLQQQQLKQSLNNNLMYNMAVSSGMKHSGLGTGKAVLHSGDTIPDTHDDFTSSAATANYVLNKKNTTSVPNTNYNNDNTPSSTSSI